MSVRYSPITLGKQLRRLSFRGFIVTETEHSGGTSLPRHAHEHPNLALVRQGRFVESSGSRVWDCRPGTAIYKPSGADHANHFGSGGTKSFLVEMLPDTVARLADATTTLAETTVVQDGRIAQLRGGGLRVRAPVAFHARAEALLLGHSARVSRRSPLIPCNARALRDRRRHGELSFLSV